MKYLSVDISQYQQLYCSKAIEFFQHRVRTRLSLSNYVDIYLPTIFFGLYQPVDHQTIMSHQGNKLIVPGGSEISPANQCFDSNMSFLQQQQNCNHTLILAISEYQSKILESHQIKHCYQRISWTVAPQLSLVNKGECIYVYTNPSYHYFYGSYIYREIYDRLKGQFQFIFASPYQQQINKFKRTLAPTHPKIKHFSEPLTVYRQCFIGLRLTPFDGNANTVKELGLCGIKTVHNGDDLSAIHWPSDPILFDTDIADDHPVKLTKREQAVVAIIEIILRESLTIGTRDHATSEKIQNDLFND